jgi:RNA polymerase sigma factor (sigma-70 family)
MRKLTKRQRDVLKLRFFKDLDYNESAKKLKTTSGNIGFHQTTAIQKLRKMMEKHLHE